MPDCPPPPPPPVEVVEGGPVAEVPLPTLHWLAARDLHAELVTACYLDATAARELALGDAAALRLELDVADARAREWHGIARRRPSWGLLVGASLVAGLGSVVAWEAVR